MLNRSFALTCGAASLFFGTARAQSPDALRSTGGDFPSAEDVVSIPLENNFQLPNGYVLPDSIDLSPWFPPAGDQGKQASCGGWALGYGIATYNWNRARNTQPDTIYLADPANVFSPTFLYTLTITTEKISDCTEGIQLPDAVRLACDTGCATLTQFPIDKSTVDCIQPIHDSVFVGAYRHRMGYPVGLDNFNEPAQWKYHLSKGNPVLFFVTINQPLFMQGYLTDGNAPFVWNEPIPATTAEWDTPPRAGHIMVCTGYTGDMYRVLNSWGQKWGDRGYLEVPGSVLQWACSDAYVVQTGFQTLPLLQPGVDVQEHVFSRTGRLKGGSAPGEVHKVDSIAFRVVPAANDPSLRVLEVLDASSVQPVHRMQVREDQPMTFHHEGSLYTWTWTGSRSDKLRFKVVKDHQDQLDHVQRQMETIDRHADGIIDGRW